MNQDPQNLWHTKSPEECLKLVSSSLRGLTETEATARLTEHGPNTLPQKGADRWYQLALRQFTSPLVYVLVGVAALTFVLGETTDGLIISFVLVFNAVIGAYQEGRAQSALLALGSYEHTKALVRRGGTEQLIPAEEVVPGDILVVLEGNRIPADARIISTESATVDEAILTGESKPKTKHESILEDTQAVPGDQTNMLFKGTYMNRGKAIAVAVHTGVRTQIGQISEQVAIYESEIPLQVKIRKLARTLVIIVFSVIGVLGIISWIQGYALREIFLTSASLLVAVMPEGLPIVVTLVLAYGVQRMAKSQVLVKRLQAVEALGRTNIIAVDKTGTLTKNQLTVTRVLMAELDFEVTGTGYSSAGHIKTHSDLTGYEDLRDRFAEFSLLSANAELFSKDGNITIAGDPTEAAMLVFGQKAGYHKPELIAKHPLLDEIAFSYERKYYANLHKASQSNILIVTGAPEVVLEKCTEVATTQGVRKITTKERDSFRVRMSSESAAGHRVIGLAYRHHDDASIAETDIKQLVWCGAFVMEDVLRKEVPHAMQQAKDAGIKVVMITGDYPSTAQTIAAGAGIFQEGDRILTGVDIESMTEADLQKAVLEASVFARVTPEHKLRIIQAFRGSGQLVAMTGDGVNDVPSLVAADLGVAMGKVGTEAAKAAGDIVLLDDNFGNIPKAVTEGKRIFYNIKKVVNYLLSANTGEVLVIAASIIIGTTIPLNPAQIVWINLLTDSFIVFPLTTEPARASANRPGKGILLGRRDLVRLTLVAGSMLAAYLLLRQLYVDDYNMMSTTVFVSIVFSQIFNAMLLRRAGSVKQFFSNHWFWISVAAVVALMLAATSLPFLQDILRTQSLHYRDWALIIGVSLFVPLIDIIFTKLWPHRE